MLVWLKLRILVEACMKLHGSRDRGRTAWQWRAAGRQYEDQQA
jgi:hypothetical protein